LEVARKAIHVAVQKKSLPLLRQSSCVVVAPRVVQKIFESSSLSKVGKNVSFFFFDTLSPTEAETANALEAVNRADVCIVCSYNAWSKPMQAKLLEKLSLQRPCIHIVLRDPLDATLASNASVIVTPYGFTLPSIEAVCERLLAL
jgi:hypothetical protein